MELKSLLLDAVRNDPARVREVFADPRVAEALGSIGVGRVTGIEIFATHLPSEGARKATGLGATLCGRKGIRHHVVTCKDCQKMAPNSAP